MTETLPYNKALPVAVAARAGVPCAAGRDEDRFMQPMTRFFRVRDVDDERVRAYVRAHPEDYRPFSSLAMKTRAEGKFPIPVGASACTRRSSRACGGSTRCACIGVRAGMPAAT